jgi:hypothetical protein
VVTEPRPRHTSFLLQRLPLGIVGGLLKGARQFSSCGLHLILLTLSNRQLCFQSFDSLPRTRDTLVLQTQASHEELRSGGRHGLSLKRSPQ